MEHRREEDAGIFESHALCRTRLKIATLSCENLRVRALLLDQSGAISRAQ